MYIGYIKSKLNFHFDHNPYVGGTGSDIFYYISSTLWFKDKVIYEHDLKYFLRIYPLKISCGFHIKTVLCT